VETDSNQINEQRGSEDLPEIADPRDNVFGWVVTLSRMTLGLGSAAAFIGWCYYALVFLGWIGHPKTLFEIFILGFPLIYLVVSLLASLGIFHRRTLLTIGILMNLPIVAPLLYWIARGYGLAPLSIIFLFFFLSWMILLLCSFMGRFEKRVTKGRGPQPT
jgi:hypothetical protein